MKAISISLTLFALIFALTSCEPTEPIPPESACIELSGLLDTPLTLTNHVDIPNAPDYCIDGNFQIRSEVIVEPGVTILMKNGARISVEAGGSFTSVGTEDENITIKGEALLTSGQWEFIRFSTDDPNNRLEYTNITGGGSDNTYDAMVFINFNGYAKIDHCTINFSQSNGIKCLREGRLGGISNTDISVCELYPIRIDAKHLKNIESTNTGGGNTYDKIYVYASQLNEPTTWRKSPIPYYLDGSLSIIDDVTVEAGTSIFMASGSNIKVNSGSLNCVGTENEKIRFLSDNWTSGSWGYISFIASNTTNNRFEHCVISDGGSSGTYKGLVTLIDNSYCRIGNSEISGSAGYGVQNQGDRSDYIDDGGNTFSDNALGNVGN
ncbi:MAG: hypothetical protein AB8H47_09360 [Bacteroidia bacterium]